METINSLTDLFKKFPGIGPRQARRFVYFLLTADQSLLDNLSDKIRSLKRDIKQCSRCGRFFNNGYQPASTQCKICSDTGRDKSSLLVVEKDIDLDTIEKARTYQGYYFVLGGNAPILDPAPETHIRFAPLLELIQKSLPEGLKELIIALSATTEGDHTTDWLVAKLRPLTDPSAEASLKITLLGRGLSTGSELEYADPDTIKNALQNRH